MMLIVSGVGSLIVAYSIAYMHDDAEERRYFAYMALFVFSMLMLVQAGNLLLLLVGWGLVGLSLVPADRLPPRAAERDRGGEEGVHHERVRRRDDGARPVPADHAHGHARLRLAREHRRRRATSVVDLVALGLLGGAVAKSAQIPLHTWLPDAMEGPTPVSALIHAATMVTAGVYLIARCHNVFELAPDVQDLAAILGAVTLVVAGSIALVQTDIKRVIAYSTMSQIGYMFVGVGVGAYSNGMFHLMTHAFFKALLFLAAGIVIHALAGEQDMRKMGGLRTLMPMTYWFFVVGGARARRASRRSPASSRRTRSSPRHSRAAPSASSSGPRGSSACSSPALYTFRMLFLVFWGEPSRWCASTPSRRNQGGAARDVLAGRRARGALRDRRLDPVRATSGRRSRTSSHRPRRRSSRRPGRRRWSRASSASCSGSAASRAAWAFYGARRAPVPRVPQAQRALERKLWFDDLYDALFYRPAVWLAKALLRWVERLLIAGSITEVALGTRQSGRLTARIQTGLVRAYALALAGGLAVLVVVFISVR